MLIDEGGGHVTSAEGGVFKHRLDEGNVGGHAANTELGQGARSAADGVLEGTATAGELDQHGVEVG